MLSYTPTIPWNDHQIYSVILSRAKSVLGDVFLSNKNHNIRFKMLETTLGIAFYGIFPSYTLIWSLIYSNVKDLWVRILVCA